METNTVEETVEPDSYTADLFASYDLPAFTALEEGASKEETRKALIQDAEEFTEVCAQHFSGLSIDYSPETYADNYMVKEGL
jgi:hypothetical protein|tara:strand:+ start:5346 stop:5591 length:246 start_codon:yes stop_codon:yes gene_type:complete